MHLWVICGQSFPKVGFKLTELIPPRSFLIHLYRVDENDPSLSTGQIEALDGSGRRKSFVGLNHLEDFLLANANGPADSDPDAAESNDLVLSSSGPGAGS